MGRELTQLSAKELMIIELLLTRGEMFGLEMVEASGSGLKRGTIYVTLSRMADKGYIDSREEPRNISEGGLPRRLYLATGLGEMVYKANLKAAEVFKNLAMKAS